MKHSTIKAIIRRLTPAGKQAIAREHLAQVFQLKNRVRNVKTGVEYTVHEVDLDSHAYLENETGDVIMPSWLTADGRFRPEVAELWERVPQKAAARMVSPDMAARLNLFQGARV